MDNTLSTLRWRRAIQIVQWEELDKSSGVDRENIHQMARRQRVRTQNLVKFVWIRVGIKLF